ncbi:MAG: alpha/beta fold hydrolase [Chloroflexota bacterium]
MKPSQPSSGYFRSGLPYTRRGRGARPLVIVQRLAFENKPQAAGMMLGYRFLERDYTLYSVLRKPGMPQGYTIGDMADDYAAMMREEFGSPVDVLGVSTGGSIAQQLAANHPDLVYRLVVHSCAHRLGDAGKQVQLEMGRLAQQGQNAQAVAVIFNFVLPPNPVLRAVARPMIGWLSHLLLGSPKQLTDLIVTIEAEDQFDFLPHLAEIMAPTLVIAGKEDPFYSEALFRETAAGIPNARLVLYEKMGHPAVGKPFEREVLAFLREA